MKEKKQKFTKRQHMLTDTFEVYHYHDDDLNAVMAHHHDFYEIYFFIKGSIEYFIEGKIYDLKAGDVLLICPLELHRATCLDHQTSYERIVLWIHPDYLAGLSENGIDLTTCFKQQKDPHANILHLDYSKRTQMFMLLEMLIEEPNSNRFCSQLAAKSLLAQLFINLNRTVIENQSVRPLIRTDNSYLVEQVVAYIDQYYTEDIVLDHIAETFLVSKYHLAHEFKRLVGTSIYHYTILRRLVNSKRMMTSGMPPTQVFHQCGFNNYSNFFRAFKNEYGINPQRFFQDQTMETL